MTQIVTALFENYDDAYEAVRRIEAAGISYRDISIVSNARDKRHVVHLGTTDDASKGASTGLGIGAALGGGAGLLAGLGMVSIPGLGPMVAAGWLAATAAGAAAGASAGGIVGALTAVGLSGEDAQVYAEGLGRGGTIVTARLAEEQQANVRSILSQCNAAEIHATGHVSRDALSADLSDASNASKATSASGKSDDPSLIASDRVRGTQVYDRTAVFFAAWPRWRPGESQEFSQDRTRPIALRATEV